MATIIFCLAISACTSLSNKNEEMSEVQPVGVENDPNTTPVDDSPYARSARRQSSPGLGISLYGRSDSLLGGGRNSNEKDQNSGSGDDPEYLEYLQWKRWQEFKAYQEWKTQQSN